MNDRHPSGTATSPAPAPDAVAAHYASYGGHGGQYGEFTTYTDTFGTGGTTTANFAADPLFGDLPGHGSTGTYDATQWSTAGHATYGDHAHPSPNYDAYAAQHQAAFDTGAHDTTAWATGYQQLAGIPAQGTSPDATGQWDAQAWAEAGQSANPAQQWEWGTQTFDTGAYDATQWNSAEAVEHGVHDQYADAADPATATFEQAIPHPFDQAESFDGTVPFDQQATAGFDAAEAFDQPPYDHIAYEEGESGDDEASGDAPPLLEDEEDIAPASRVAARSSNRARRRAPAKRSALLTVAVPSVCVMGVAGIAAASVGVNGEDGRTTSASAATPVKPSAANNKLDSQLESLSAGANDFADRASRTQERIDLKAEQAAEQRKAAAEAALKERMRPKFVLPVLQKGLSAYFGQAGINWMSVHTGIDFPVSYGTTVMAATDGTVRTQWNSAYGNMLILTAKDGTETWYCHLSTYRVSSGTTVKAGQPIAYSGNSGNSTGPHLHFEVRPGGGAAIDPLPWLRSHGLDPT
ncbi:M23 family metallopeptidase [Streptomyces sp. NPDC046984]|uniref:M23 family metallopeptidase n=1 Tax=Streptomyces sp. NPDC046984 TaxID=3155138 RepID=UPI0033C96333